MTKIYKLILLLILAANVQSNAQVYCAPAYTSGTASNDYIAGVQLNTISNLNSNVAGSAFYVDYTSTLSTTLNTGQTYTMTITGSPYSAGENYAVFIDYDGNGDFLGTNENIYQSAVSTIANQVFTFVFTVPTGIANINTRMRVVNTYSSTALTVSSCPSYTYGETEDYGLTIFTPISYCSPVYTTGTASNDYIAGVQLNTISNLNSNVAGGPSYTDYTTLYSTSLTSGSTYPMTITGSTYGSGEIYAVFIDYNGDGDFLDVNESVTQTAISTSANQVFTFNITIPSGLSAINTRMRVVNTYSSSAITVLSCPSYTYGETEDYGISIVANAIAPPVANFSTNFSTITVGGSTNFYDLSTNTPTSWSWSFPGGTPATSTVQNPTNIVYNSTGCYNVTLTVTNAYGSNSITATCFINVLPVGQQYCLPNPTNGTSGGDYINNVTLGGISNLGTGSNTGASYSYINTMSADLTVGTLNTLTIQNGTWATDTIAVWIDYNNDGDFADAGEKIDQIATTTASTDYLINFTVPSNVVGGIKVMRIRILDNSAAVGNADPCTDYLYGETEDYLVNVIQAASPVASFVASNYNPTIGTAINFFDTSTNSPTTWSWSFPGSTTPTSTLQNPTVTYNTAGCYTVTLTATNIYGSNTYTFTCCVLVTTGASYCNTSLHSVDCTAGYINGVSITNTTLNIQNSGCSSSSELGYVNWSPTGNGTGVVNRGVSYPFNIITTVPSIISVWIDYNHDGTFATTEWTQITTASTANVAATANITIPNTALLGATRMRVRSRNTGAANASTDPCTLFGSGETEDFNITIASATATVPVANFIANSTTINLGQSVTFTDLSTNNPTSWSWTFAGGTPSTSTSQNPIITYNTAGTYTVTLIATNSAGSNTSTHTAYITVINTVTVSSMGSSANIYTALVEESNCLTANQDLNTIMFTHRKNTGDAGNSGYVQTSYSTNTGVTFDSTLTIVSDATNLSRYPSGAIFNPSGNTTLSNAVAVVSGPYTQTTGWAGNYFASSKMNNTLNNQLFYNNAALPLGQIKSDFARYGIESNSSSVVVCGGRYLDLNGTTIAAQGFSGAVLHKGIYSATTGQLTWTPKYIRHSFAHSTTDNSALAVTSPMSAWSANGTIGYLVFIGVDSVGRAALTNKRYQPIVYKTINSGTTWTQMPLANFGAIANISSFLLSTNSGTKAPFFNATNGFDVTVDYNNNLHIVSAIQACSSEHVDSLDYSWNSQKLIYDVYTTTTGWNAMLLDSVKTDAVDLASSPWVASDGSGSNGWGARIQISKSSDGKRIFYGWVDTEPTWGTTNNLHPDIFVKGFNAETNLLTITKNFTSTNSTIGGKSYFHYISNISLKNGTTYTIPASVIKARNNATSAFDAIAPIQHLYVRNIQFTDADFTITPLQGTATNPVAAFNYFPTSVCVGSPVTFNNNSTNATSYTWTFQGGTPATSTNASPDIIWTTSGTKTITLVASNGTTTNTATQTIVINAAPTVNLGSDVSICSGASTTLNAGNAGASFVWSPAVGLNNTSAQSVTATPTTTTTYIATVTNANGCSASDNITVTVNNVSANAGLDVTICGGSSTALSASGGTTYSWSPSTGLSSTSGNAVQANPAATTIYTVTATNNGCTATDNVTVNVNTVLANAGTDANICPGGSTQLLATGGTSYSWSPSVGLNNISVSNPIATPSATTTYTVTVTNGNCTATDAVVVNVNNVVANAGNDANICLGSSAQLSASGGSSYSWSPSSGLSSASIANPVATPSTTTTYTVIVNNNGCTSSDAVTVTVNSSAANAGNDVTICAGNSVQLGASGGVTYAWSPSTGLSSTTVANPIANPTSTITYLVTATNGSCVTSDFVTVTVANTLNVSAGNNQTLCSGQTLQLNATGGAQYTWSPSVGLSNANISNPVASPTSTTTYTVNTFSGACSSTAQVTITVVAGITASAGNDITLCNGASTGLNATGGTSYTWTPATGLSNANVANPIAFPTSTTTYVVTATTAGCSDADTLVVTVGNATANAGIDVALCSGQNTTLNASGGTNYSWSPASGLSNANISNPVALPSATTTYTVTVTSGICTATDNVTITVSSVSVNAGQDVQICSGASANLNAQGSGATTYSWTPTTGISNPNIANPTVSPIATTTYTITVTDGLCTSSDNVNITVNTNPTIPVITANSSTLSATNAVGYQWYLNGFAIPLATSQQYAPTSNGSYTVVVSNGNGCTATSAVFNVITVNIKNLDANANITIYPNPVNEILNVEFGLLNDNYSIEISDVQGRIVMSDKITLEHSTYDLQMLNSGVYFVKIKTEQQTIVKRIVKN